MNKVVESRSNETFHCQMNCQITPDEWETICNNWKIPELCEKENQGSHLNMDATVIRSQVNKMSQCIFFHIHRSTILDQQTSMYCPPDNATNKILKSPCEVQCNDEAVMDVITSATDDEVKASYQFWMFFLFMIFSWVGMAVVVSVGDAICFELLGDQPQKYGYQRLWGSIGWGTFSIISGLLIDKFSEGHTNKNYSVGFYLMIVLIGFDIFASSKIKTNQTKISTNIFKDIGKIFTSCRVIVFFLWCILVGLGTAMIWNFLFWHLENLAGCDNTEWLKTLQGLVMGIQCFGGELPFFFLSGWILKKIGHVNAMSLVLLGFSVRFFFYSILENPWWVLPVELLNGVTFGIFYATMASYASIVAPPGTETTMQVSEPSNSQLKIV
jgi:MFS family permease